jgi:hypothetical protein
MRRRTRDDSELLAGTLTRVAGLRSTWCLLPAPTSGAWLPANAVPDLLEGLLDQVARHYRAPDLTVAGSFWIGGYAARLAGPTLAAMITEGRVPDISADNLLLRFDQRGYVSEAALRRPTWAGGGDPAPVRVSGGRPSLRRYAHDRLIGQHLERLAEPLTRLMRRTDRAFRASVSDACANAFLRIAKAGADPTLCRIEATAFADLAPPQSPRAQLISRPDRDVLPIGLRRVGCCLAFRVPTMGPCTSCPHLGCRPEKPMVSQAPSATAAAPFAATSREGDLDAVDTEVPVTVAR